MLSRGGREFSAVISFVADKMKGLQTWWEEFEFNLWTEGALFAHLSIDEAIGAKDISKPLPFEHIDLGISREFLLKEREKAYNAETTSDCAFDVCHQCGACDFKKVKPEIKKEKESVYEPKLEKNQEDNLYNRGNAFAYLFTFSKIGRAVSIGHLDTVDFIIKGFLMCKLPVLYSEGFHPLPRVSLNTPLPVGVESDDETGIVWFKEALDVAETINKLNHIFAHSGIKFLNFEELQRESVKEVEKKHRNTPKTKYFCRFTNKDDMEKFVELVEKINMDLEKLELTFMHEAAKGSVMKLFGEDYSDYYLRKLQ